MGPNTCHFHQAQPPILLFGCQAPGSRPPPPGVCLSRDAGCFAPPLLPSLPSYLGWCGLESKTGTEERLGLRSMGCQCRGTRWGTRRRQREGDEAQTLAGDGDGEGGALAEHAQWQDAGEEMLGDRVLRQREGARLSDLQRKGRQSPRRM